MNANLPPKPAPAPKRRTTSPRIGQRDTHYNIEIQVLERVKELEQRAILNNLDHREELSKDEVVERTAFIDPLTRLYNPRTFAKEMDFEVKRARRYKRPISLCMLIVDNLTDIRVRYGALTADVALKTAAATIQSAIREIDIACRYTTEHIAILMPETNEADGAVVVERIRQRIKKQNVVHGKLNLELTASIGLTSFPSHGKDLENMMSRAKKALNKAIEEGGDKYLLG